MDSKIPQVFHYCWFGYNDKPKIIKKCIDSWKQFHPDWEIIEWNESNYDVNKNAYISEAYKQKKWAFVCDFARFDILNQYGGVFLDADVEFVKSIPDEFMEYDSFAGFETEGRVAPGLIWASIPNHNMLQNIIDVYSKKKFGERIENGRIENIVDITTKILLEKGLQINNSFQIVDGIAIFPKEVFCCFDHESQTYTITDEAIAVHRYCGSWSTWNRKLYYWILRRFIRILGKDRYLKIKRFIKGH